MAANVINGALLGGTHPMLLAKVDRIEVGGVWRQVPEPGGGSFDQTAQGSRFMAAEIVHDDDVTG